MAGFYYIGASAVGEGSTAFLSVNLALLITIGFFVGITPLRTSMAITQLPISRRAIQWDGIIGLMRLPLVITLVMTVPFYVGRSSNGYYSFVEILLLILSILVVALSCYIAANSASQLLKALTHNSFVRFMAMISVLILMLEFFSRSNQAVSALERTFNSISSGEALLVILASVGIIGAAVTAIEASEPVITKHRRSPFWSLMTHHRNFNNIPSLGESVFIRELLFFLRNVTTHLIIAVILVLFLLTQALGASLFNSPVLGFLILGVALGLISYFVSFPSGRRFYASGVRLSHLPLNRRQTYWGSFAASGLITVLLGGVLAQLALEQLEMAGPLTLLVLVSIPLSLHCLAFNSGVRVGDRNDELTLLDEGLGIILIFASIAFALVLFSFLNGAKPSEAIAISVVWALVYSFGGLLLLKNSRA
ncbi:MAG: hypothetical protein HZB70_00545 [Candidatus Berkelbacteria bacterium]|nr:MAG: hypothetical protein HZB70_00545 [Candidatus Berkelbacteria bacterium]QQG51404.1 MAG: hypothetical protein HY845_02455 [Candidatus Berkelbacteria bacterium]